MFTTVRAIVSAFVVIVGCCYCFNAHAGHVEPSEINIGKLIETHSPFPLKLDVGGEWQDKIVYDVGGVNIETAWAVCIFSGTRAPLSSVDGLGKMAGEALRREFHFDYKVEQEWNGEGIRNLSGGGRIVEKETFGYSIRSRKEPDLTITMRIKSEIDRSGRVTFTLWYIYTK